MQLMTPPPGYGLHAERVVEYLLPPARGIKMGGNKVMTRNFETCKYIPIINKKMIYKLPIEEILYIEYKNRRADFFTEKGNVYMYHSMEEILEYLDDNFQSCGKTLILNLSKITSICDTRVEFLDGNIIFVNRAGCVRLKQLYARYLIEHK